MDSTLLRIADICFSEIEDTPYLAITQLLESPSPEKDGSSLKVLSIQTLFAAALKNKEMKQQVKEIVSNEFLMLHNIHYLESQSDLLLISINKNCFIRECVLGITIKSRNSHITINGQAVGKFPIPEDFEWFRTYINLAIRHRCKKFRVTVKDIQNETPQEMLDRILKELPVFSSPPCGNVCTLECYTHKTFHIGGRLGSTLLFERDTGVENCRIHEIQYDPEITFSALFRDLLVNFISGG